MNTRSCIRDCCGEECLYDYASCGLIEIPDHCPSSIHLSIPDFSATVHCPDGPSCTATGIDLDLPLQPNFGFPVYTGFGNFTGGDCVGSGGVGFIVSLKISENCDPDVLPQGCIIEPETGFLICPCRWFIVVSIYLFTTDPPFFPDCGDFSELWYQAVRCVGDCPHEAGPWLYVVCPSTSIGGNTVINNTGTPVVT